MKSTTQAADAARAIVANLKDADAHPVRHSDDEVSRAVAVLRRDYYGDVRDIAQDIAERVASGELTDADDVEEAIRETVDGCARVIYTFQAKLGLLASDNEDAYQDDTGEEPSGPSVAMYYAVCADVRDELADLLGLDSDAWEATDEDAEGGEA